ncbi:MAG: phosphoenolpyruvate--protein phosphotransferase [Hyphomicrobiaceae bacterium]|nr:phosphoenolpyruvate--protein phosphotransferase [Hyphomicrobiaceae bacterium]
MQGRRNEEHGVAPSEPTLRIIMRRLRDIMAESGDGQSRLDKIVRHVAGVMVAEVCSIYLKRQDGSLELFATEGLNPQSVHTTRLKRGEGLVGRCAELGVPVNEPDAQKHPAYSYRPETGEEVYHSLLAVPILRSGQVLGVLVVQNHAYKQYSDDDVETLASTAMVVGEHLASGSVANWGADIEISRSLAAVIRGDVLSEGIALGHVVLHEPRIVVTKLMADDPALELRRLEGAIAELRAGLDEMLGHQQLASDGDHRDVLEAYRMFAHDRGWERRLREAVQSGLTAEAGVERVQNSARARMLRQADAYWAERQRDFDDLSDRLLRILAGRSSGSHLPVDMPSDTVLVARTMGPAELLDYDPAKLRGLVIEDGSPQSHVAIVAKALGIPAVGRAVAVVEHVSPGDGVIIDGETGEVHLRPLPDVVSAYSDKVRFRARRQQKYEALRDKKAITKDGRRIEVNINAGLLYDLQHMEESGADGIGLFRTELQFMVSHTFPRLERQAQSYRQVVEAAGGKPIVFRALDIGGDKVLPYLHAVKEENPAIGWRAIRMSLDRPALFRTQVRALLKATAGGELRLMVPMISTAAEMLTVKAMFDRELGLIRRKGLPSPERVKLGAMFEVPSLFFELDALLKTVDFLSIGSNDLLQFLFAADRTNARVANRYDPLSVAPLRALKMVADACRGHGVPVTVCGEMAGRPLEALALIALGFRSISMAPSCVGPMKAMVLSLDADLAAAEMERLLARGEKDMRGALLKFARKSGVDL